MKECGDGVLKEKKLDKRLGVEKITRNLELGQRCLIALDISDLRCKLPGLRKEVLKTE